MFSKDLGKIQRTTKMSELHEPYVDVSAVKQEPLDVDFKSDLVEGSNQFDYSDINPFAPNPSAWSLIVDRTLVLLHEENSHLSRSTIIKALVKEVNSLLYDVINLFQDCCKPIGPDEKSKGEMLEVDGLLVNCLPCLPDKFTCHYRINSDIPQFYNDTLFSVLNNYNGEDNQNYTTDSAPNADIDVKKEIKPVVVNKKPKVAVKEKVKAAIVCDQCGKTFKAQETLKNHVRVKHDKMKIFKCRECKKSFSYQRGLREHRLICKGPLKENRWIYYGKEGKKASPKCIHPDCVGKENESFTPTGIYKHILAVHNAPTEFDLQCPECSEKFPMKCVLKYHREIEHQVRGKMCPICGKDVKRVNYHILRYHTKEKSIQCDKCDYRCRVQSQLSIHMKIHQDPEDRKYKCELCFKGFHSKQKLNEHVLTHANIKPFKCEFCNQAFSNHSGHRQHMMRKHGLKFTCEICGFDSSSQKWLEIHMRDKHGPF